MSISAFFEGLGAPFANRMWSWGATDDRGRVILRAWKDRIESLPNGGQRIKLLDGSETPRSSNLGYNERRRHLAAIREGSEGFIVVVKAVDAHSSPRRIESFETGSLLRLSGVKEDNGDQWGVIDGAVPTRSFRN